MQIVPNMAMIDSALLGLCDPIILFLSLLHVVWQRMQWRGVIILFSICTFILVIYLQWETIVQTITELKHNNTVLQQRILQLENNTLHLEKWKQEFEQWMIDIDDQVRMISTINNVSYIRRKDRYRLAVGILTRHESKDARDAIRETWLRLLDDSPKKNFTYRFVLGYIDNKELYEKSKRESFEYGDILFVDQIDTYTNISYKSMEIFRWASEDIHADYVFKTDDDSFVRLDKLMDLLDTTPTEKYYGGKILGYYGPDRDPKSKYYMPYDEYPAERGPQLVSGSGYLLSNDCVAFLAQKTHTNISYYRLEDVNTMTLLQEMGVKTYDIPGCLIAGGCDNNMLFTHYRMPATMREYYNNFKTSGKPCGKKRAEEIVDTSVCGHT